MHSSIGILIRIVLSLIFPFRGQHVSALLCISGFSIYIQRFFFRRAFCYNERVESAGGEMEGKGDRGG
jgi:hypothetical protein